MITLAWYFLKVIICSGILYGYYYACLRNKIFHRWNRFYLIASIILSLAAPLIKITIFQNSAAGKGTVVRMLQTINNSDEIVIEYNRSKGLHLSSENIIEVLYLSGTVAFMVIFLLALYKIYRLRKKYPETKFNGINFISTDAKGTPFSFFNSIFWNRAIDLNSKHGQQIFNHEIAHVKEKHSYDKVFMNVALIFFWINPFFWLMQKELNMIHEFIADKDALEDNDINAFAEMILQTVYPGQQFSIANNFFHSPLKRRLLMFTKNKNSKVTYVSRLLVLPLATIIFFAFTIKMNPIQPAGNYSGKQMTAIIDAGHGGEDNGAISQNGLLEKDISLSIAKEIVALNSNTNIKILLSRNNDKSIPVKDRVEFASLNHADLFISIHINTADKNHLDEKGFSVLIDKKNSEKNKLLASALIEELRKSYATQDAIGVRENNVYVIDNNICPAALIECGYLTNTDDEAFISKIQNQKKIAKNILDAINNYAEQNLSYASDTKISKIDTTPKIKTHLYGSFRPNVKIQNSNSEFYLKAGTLGKQSNSAKQPLYFVDGKEISKEELRNIVPTSIESLNVLKGESAIAIYGEKARGGVVLITTKHENLNSSITMNTNSNASINSVHLNDLKNNAVKLKGNPKGYIQNDTIPDMLFTKVENEAEFPGGQEAWVKYIVSQIQKNQAEFTKKDFGTCVVKFIVNKDGSVTNVEATTMKDSRLAKVSMDAIRNGPKWISATQNGQIVAAYRLQPITLTNPDKN